MSPKNRNESRISKPGRPKGRFLGSPGGRGEDSSPFRLTSSLLLHALHPGGVRRIQNEVKIELWALRDLIFGILGGFARGLIFDEFLIGLKIRKSRKSRRRCEKRISAARVGGRGGVPERLWSLLKRQESTESAKVSRTPCPLRAGGGGFKGYRL